MVSMTFRRDWLFFHAVSEMECMAMNIRSYQGKDAFLDLLSIVETTKSTKLTIQSYPRFILGEDRATWLIAE